LPVYRSPKNDLRAPSNSKVVPEAEDLPRAVAAVGGSMITKSMELAMHQHRKAQLILTLRGVVRCEADQGVWIVPPRCAVWIPGDVPHSVTLAGDVETYCLFVEPDAAPTLPPQCCTVSVSPLFEHLLLHVARMPALYDVDGPDGRVATVLLDQLALAPVEKLNFPMPLDPRLRKIANSLMTDPADRATIDEWGRRMATAPRTLTRALQRETGMSFGRWRQQLHVLIALERLDQGCAVQTVALELGYEGSSAFITMFRKALGKPPSRYLAERRIA
jgi:AraC-like DNA-binding protein/quercetin dioxygenase-like cupin family protein